VIAIRLRNAFIAALAGWAALLVAAPFFASRAHASTLTSALILGVYGIGSLVCHQLPARSFHLWTAQMPVCARCAGIYAGGVLGALGALSPQALGARSLRALGARAFQASENGSGRSAERLALHRPRVLLALAVAPTLASLAYEWTTGDMPSHAIRAAAGVPLGLVVAWLVVAAADNQVN
jgi:Predicted membrane protein (DUF2085)